MKKTIISCLTLFSVLTYAQDKMITKTGTVEFEASVPSFEEVKAKNESATCVFNTKTGQIASLVLVKGFRFKVALMEEHFNENYVDSERHPKATFKGEIMNFDIGKVSAEGTKFTMKGELSFNGKTKNLTTTAVIKKTMNSFIIHSEFDLYPREFGIEIPSVVSAKIAKAIHVTTDFEVK
ncbi:MAG: YceI family protein [Flavobacteriales bacterium]|nr:YceI family protein [Flavobacteriales bacterium]